MGYKTLLVEKSGPTALVTLSRPEKLNALTFQTLGEFAELFVELRQDLSTRFTVFTGAGAVFSVGFDLTDAPIVKGAELAYAMERLGQLQGHDFMHNLENLEQITIAAVNGKCMGAGLALAMACDFRIASSNAIFGLPETKVGTFLTWGCTPRLTSLIGPSKAMEMIMTCDNVDAEEAFRIGLVNKVVSPQHLMEAVDHLVDKIDANAPLASRIAKKMVNAARASGFGNLYLCEPELLERLAVSYDLKEGMKAFLEKRSPKFRDS
jgi:enoyl-CoA hydratase